MLEQTCRTCLATCGELVSIFSNEYYVRDLSDKLFHTTRIEVSKDDELPKMMCKKCIFLVDSLYCFKDQCEMAEIKLKKSLKNNENEVPLTSPVINNYEIKISNKVSNNSDGSSSDEDYQIEYASEEARLEVESAKKQRNAKKKHKPSGVKVKSVEILDSRTKENIYKNLCAPVPSYAYEPEVQEKAMVTDSEDGSSLYLSEDSRKYLSSVPELQTYEPQSYQPQSYEPRTSENTDFLKHIKQEEFIEKPSNSTLKRKIDSDNSYSQLTKVPKKVMFQDNDYRDENMQFIELTNNKGNLSSENLTNKSNSVVQVNVIENSTGKIVQNYDFPVKDNTAETRRILVVRAKNLMKHLAITLPEVCAICSKSFDTYSDVLEHKIRTHLSKNQDFFFCPICHDKFYSNNHLVNHLNKHTDIHSYICVVCTGSYYTEESLRTHLQSHVDIRELKCKICVKKFQRIQQVILHMNQHVLKKHLVCTLCSANFETKDKLQNHIDQEHRRYEETTIKWEESEEVDFETVPQNTNNQTGFPCPYCEHVFTIKTALRDHVITHLGGQQQYTCLVCEKTFPTQEDRTQHMQEHMKPQQNDRKKFRCRVCHEILVSRVAYGEHLKEKHWPGKQADDVLGDPSEGVERANDSFGKSDDIPEFDNISST